MAIVLICLASAVTAFYIAAPFWRVSREQNTPRTAASRALSGRKTAVAALTAQRDGLLREIKDLEFDRRMGKIDRDAHDAMRSELTTQAKAVLHQIETLNSSKTSPRNIGQVASPSSERALELEMESEILIARARRRLATTHRAEDARWQCDCGRVMQNSDAFCASCGAPYPRETATVAA